MTTRQHADPLNAEERPRTPFRNFAKCISNEIIDMPLKLKERSGISAGTPIAFWQIEFEAADAAFSDGTPLTISFGNRLYQKISKDDKGDGDSLGKEMPPHVCSSAFAGLGFSAFPDSPGYDGSEIGQWFLLEQTQFGSGDVTWNRIIPIECLGPDFVYDGDVRTIQTREEKAAGMANPPLITQTIELKDDEAAMTIVTEALQNIDLDDRGAVLRAVQVIGTGKTVGGKSFLGLAASGQLVDALKSIGAL